MKETKEKILSANELRQFVLRGERQYVILKVATI